MTLIETTVGTLAGNDIGARAVIVFDGRAIDGTIDAIQWIKYETKRGVECYELRIKTGKASTFSLTGVPLDYRIQIERPIIGIDPAGDGPVAILHPSGVVEVLREGYGTMDTPDGPMAVRVV